MLHSSTVAAKVIVTEAVTIMRNLVESHLRLKTENFTIYLKVTIPFIATIILQINSALIQKLHS